MGGYAPPPFVTDNTGTPLVHGSLHLKQQPTPVKEGEDSPISTKPAALKNLGSKHACLLLTKVLVTPGT